MATKKCKVCGKNIRQSGPGRPRLTHERCKGKAPAKKKTTKKKTTKKKTTTRQTTATKKKTKKRVQRSTSFASRQSAHSNQSRKLQPIFDKLNEEYFNGRCSASVRYSRRAMTSLWGYYMTGNNSITINHLLARPDSPYECLEMIVYHEMLHEDIPDRTDPTSGCRVIHGPDFKRREKLHPYYNFTKRWLKENGHKLHGHTSRGVTSRAETFQGINKGDTFTVRRTTYTVTGFAPNRWKFPITAEGPRGGIYKFRVEDVKGKGGSASSTSRSASSTSRSSRRGVTSQARTYEGISVDDTFQAGGTIYTVTGFSPRRRKYPVTAKGPRGGVYKFSLAAVKNGKMRRLRHHRRLNPDVCRDDYDIPELQWDVVSQRSRRRLRRRYRRRFH